MKKKILSGILLVAAALAASAQRGLKEIPNPDVDFQEAAFRLPAGASINLFASDPQITKPIHMNWDGQGRLWVVGSPLYPHIKPGEAETDRLYVLEDTNGDGTANKVSEFAADLHIPTAVLPGDGGVYVANSTEIIFLRDNDGDGRSDERRIVLSGFGTEDTHHLLHTFRWGPAGHLWMNQSIYIHSHVETPYGVRRLLGGGMWHFRPETGRLEVFMKGLVNSWGHIIDEWGQSFMTDGAGGDGINYVFPRFVGVTSPGASRVLRGLNPGQPKHCGLEIVTGRHVPEDWVGTLLAPDFRGHRINRFRLTDKGGGYVSTKLDDLVSSTHRAFRPIDVKMGPDGAIYIADWYNPIIQHGEVDFRDPRRDHAHGRIWRISFPGRSQVRRPTIVDASPAELVSSLDAPEGLTRTLAAAELRGRPVGKIMPVLEKWYASLEEGEDLQKMRAVWGSQAVGALRRDWAENLVASSANPKARAAALRALYYTAGEQGITRALLEKAVEDPSPQVRLWAVSLLAQLPWADTVALALRALEKEGVDQYLDFAVWSICREHSGRWVPLARKRNPFRHTWQLFFAGQALKKPIGIEHVLTSLAAGEFAEEAQLDEVINWVANVGDASHLEVLFSVALAEGAPESRQVRALRGLRDAARLRKQRPTEGLVRLNRFLDIGRGEVFSEAAALAGMWKLEGSRAALEKAFLGEEPGSSNAALEGLRALGGAKTRQFFSSTARNPDVEFSKRRRAVVGQTRLDPEAGAELAPVLLRGARGAGDVEVIVEAFLANKSGPAALAGVLGRPGFSMAPQMALVGLNRASSSANKSEALIAAFRKAGSLKPMKLKLTAAEMEAMMERVKTEGDASRGEQAYRRKGMQCIACHAIGGSGGIIGPDLVSIGSSAPVDYLIESMLEPSKKIKEGYHTAVVTTSKGDVVAGAIARQDETEIVIRDAKGLENRVPRKEVASMSISPVSLMPVGLTAQLREDEFVDLIRFLSELGKEGPYKTTEQRFVRNWEVLGAHERTRDAIGHYGKKAFVEKNEGFRWTPLVARVDGTVPGEELPQVEGRGKTRFGVARFRLRVNEAGKVSFRLTGKLSSMTVFIDDTEIQTPQAGTGEVIETVRPLGTSVITVVRVLGEGGEGFSVELLGEPGVIEVAP